MPNELTAISGEWQINAATAADQDESRVVFVPDAGGGYFTVVYESHVTSDIVLGRSIELDGTFLSSESTVTPEGPNDVGDPDLVTLSDGTPLLLYEDFDLGTVNVRWGTGTGTTPFASGTNMQLLSNPDGFRTTSIAALEGGGFAIAAEPFSGGLFLSIAALFDADGMAVGSDINLDPGSGSSFYPVIAQSTLGDVIVGYSSVVEDPPGTVGDFSVFSQFINATTGRPKAPPVDLAEDFLFLNTATTTLADGRILVGGEGRDNFTSNDGSIVGGYLAADGFAELLPDRITDLPDRANGQLDLAGTPDGGFIAVWTSANPDNSDDSEIRIRRFDVDGVAVGASEVVNAGTLGKQEEPSVAVSPDGRVIVTWTSDDLLGTDGENVFGRIYQLDDLGTPGGVFDGGPGVDRLVGSANDDTLNGFDGADVLDGGAGADTMAGGLGNDFYFVDTRADVITGEVAFSLGGGIDTVRSFVSYVQPDNIELVRLGNLTDTDDLNAVGNDAPGTLVGNAGGNRLTGRGGNDQINGNNGDDTLIGNTGRDTLVGGNGNDTFVITAYADSRAGAENRDVINGFFRTPGQDDVIDLSALDANTRTFGVDDAFVFIGAERFSGTAGELRYQGLGGPNAVIVEADHNGDGVADLQLFVNLTTFMTGSDFIL